MPQMFVLYQYQDLLCHFKWCRICFHQPYEITEENHGHIVKPADFLLEQESYTKERSMVSHLEDHPI